jgi:hypothetical protein
MRSGFGSQVQGNRWLPLVLLDNLFSDGMLQVQWENLQPNILAGDQ